MVVPSAFNSDKSAITSLPFCESKFPVGSSAKINFGLATTARAIAIRCCFSGKIHWVNHASTRELGAHASCSIHDFVEVTSKKGLKKVKRFQRRRVSIFIENVLSSSTKTVLRFR